MAISPLRNYRGSLITAGGLTINRRQTLNLPAWTAVNVRDGGWTPAPADLAAYGLTVADFLARAIVVRADSRIVDVGAGDALRVARFVPVDANWNSADDVNNIVRLDIPPRLLRPGWFWMTAGGPLVIETEVWFDVPTAEA